jgi:hypothetical protein
MKKEINFNKKVLVKYSEDQLAAWAKDNGLDADDLAEVKASLKENTEDASSTEATSDAKKKPAK